MAEGERTRQHGDDAPADARRCADAAVSQRRGILLVAAGAYFTVWLKWPLPAAIAGAAVWRSCGWVSASRPFSPVLVVFDALAFALFAYQRNDGLGFWQLPGPWADVFRVNVPGAVLAMLIYVGGSVYALVAAARGLRLVEAFALIVTPFCSICWWCCRPTGTWRRSALSSPAHAGLPFPAQAAIGRALTLFCPRRGAAQPRSASSRSTASAVAPLASRVRGRRDPRGATPHVANAAQLVTNPVLAIVFSAACAAIAQGGLVGDRLSDDRRPARLARRPAAALRRDLGPLADRADQGRDLWRAVHGLHPVRRAGAAHARNRGDPARRRADRRPARSARRSFRWRRRSSAARTGRRRSSAA